ncbi:MAG: hypothetical protein ACLP8S_01085 [Solirubrobacteraceae bacterium]
MLKRCREALLWLLRGGLCLLVLLAIYVLPTVGIWPLAGSLALLALASRGVRQLGQRHDDDTPPSSTAPVTARAPAPTGFSSSAPAQQISSLSSPAAAIMREIASSRIGEPVLVVCPCVITLQQAPHEDWHGEHPLWVALSDTHLLLFHQTPTGGVGGVKSRFTRAGAHTRWVAQPDEHLAEISWPENLWMITLRVRGPRAQRELLRGLLAADELGVRGILKDA